MPNGSGNSEAIFESGWKKFFAPKQTETLNEFTRQTRAYPYLSHPNSQLVGELGMTEEQQGKLRLLGMEMGNWAREDREERIDKILAVLTPQQRARLREEAFGPDWPDSNPQLAIEVGGDVGKIYVPDLAPYPDFTKEDVRKGLGLNPQQQNQVRELLGGASDLAEKLVEEWQKLSPAERKTMEEPAVIRDAGSSGGSFRSDEERKKWEAQLEEKARKARQEQWAKRQQDPMVKANAQLVKQFEAILTPQQLARYKDMAFRNRVDEGLVDQIILRKIGANDQQIEGLERLFDESVERYHRLTREMGGKMLRVLTPAQQEKLLEDVFSSVPFRPAPPPAKKASAASPTESEPTKDGGPA